MLAAPRHSERGALIASWFETLGCAWGAIAKGSSALQCLPSFAQDQWNQDQCNDCIGPTNLPDRVHDSSPQGNKETKYK